MSDKPRVVLIDLSSLWWQAYMVNAENGVREPRSVTLANVKQCTQPGDLVAICCDSGKSFRKELEPTYKANREKQPPAAYAELEKTKERLRADGYLLWSVDGFEADDIIASACKTALNRGHEVRICSSDKDMLQLLNVRVDCLRTHTWQVATSRDVLEKFRVDPEQFRDFLALWGDSSDNIPGCKGIGQVRAAELITKYETIDRIYEALDANKEVSTPANERNLREQREAVMLSRKLVTLCYDAPIDFGQIYEERKAKSLTENRGVDMEETPDETDSAPQGNATSALASGVSMDSTESEDSGKTVALVPVQVEYERQLEPTSMERAFKLACTLFDSRLYSRFPNEQAIMAVIVRGREMGLGALASLDSFHIIEGRPCPHAYLMIARAKADPDCEYFQCVETTGESATWETKNRRNPKPTRLTYTLDQAKASGLYQQAQEKTTREGKKYMSKDNQWVVRPDEMVRKTAGVQLARMEYPAATMGLYAWEEMGGE